MTPGQMQAGLVMTFMVAVVALVLAGAGLNRRVDNAVDTANRSKAEAVEARKATCDFIAAFMAGPGIPPATSDKGRLIEVRAKRLYDLGCR